jgi:hypothetical protein
MDDVIDFNVESKFNREEAPEGIHVGEIRVAEMRRAQNGNPYAKIMIIVGNYAPINVLIFFNNSYGKKIFANLLGEFNVFLEKRKYTIQELSDITTVLIGQKIQFRLTRNERGFVEIKDVKKYEKTAPVEDIPADDIPPF